MIWTLLFWIYLTDLAVSFKINRQHREEKTVMDNMTHHDDRLPNKTRVWGSDGSDQGKLQRVESLKPGFFRHVCVEFFQATDINRLNKPS